MYNRLPSVAYTQVSMISSKKKNEIAMEEKTLKTLYLLLCLEENIFSDFIHKNNTMRHSGLCVNLNFGCRW